MHRFRHLIIFSFLISMCPVMLKAQESEFNAVLKTGHNAIFGGFAAISLEGVHTLCEDLSLRGGLQYNSIGKTSLEVRPTYHIPFDWGKITAEALLSYTNLTSVNSFSGGAGAGIYSDRISARLGYYYRLYGGQESWINEPFNIYYEFRAHFLRKIQDWMLDLVITNSETFELERHYQPSYLAECYHNIGSRLAVLFALGYKPAGTFNISADYYQSYIKAGLCYRW